MKHFYILLLTLILSSLACSAPAWAPNETPNSVKISTPNALGAGKSLLTRTPNATPAPRRAAVSALQSLNVREKATKQSRSLGVLYAGESVTLTGECKQGSRWARIKYKDGLAWVDAHYLSGHICEEE